jgi:nitrate/nitrite transporter NarK
MLQTFSIPAQIFPTRLRATAHGISAAFGKLGAVTGAFIFPQIYASMGLEAVMGVMAMTSALTLVWTWAFVPSYGPRDLEKIERSGKGTTIEQQAVSAQLILDDSCTPESECLPLSLDRNGAKYGATS